MLTVLTMLTMIYLLENTSSDRDQGIYSSIEGVCVPRNTSARCLLCRFGFLIDTLCRSESAVPSARVPASGMRGGFKPRGAGRGHDWCRCRPASARSRLRKSAPPRLRQLNSERLRPSCEQMASSAALSPPARLCPRFSPSPRFSPIIDGCLATNSWNPRASAAQQAIAT